MDKHSITQRKVRRTTTYCPICRTALKPPTPHSCGGGCAGVTPLVMAELDTDVTTPDWLQDDLTAIYGYLAQAPHALPIRKLPVSGVWTERQAA